MKKLVCEGSSKSLSDGDTYTDWVILDGNEWSAGAAGTWGGTVTVQAVAPGGDIANDADIQDLETFTANFCRAGFPLCGGWKVRAGFKYGEFSSGAAAISVFRKPY